MTNILILVFILLLGLTSKSFAYLDPGTGTFILQALIGFIAAGFVAFTSFWTKFKNLVTKIFKKKNKRIK